ncbi:uncharacterized protein LOC124373724 [Homalodisca vitripennis]|uniref:uncharacterized protein LOC124373724 n=1 Tax=Homalodisca vitripennis TaxID=197043 RepID=UPI001EEA7FEF|nr:uncharacterized protein LOC124373724 [Homalodisca vitripennis]
MLPGAGVTVWLALPALLLAAEDLDSSTCLTLDPFDSALPQTTPSPYTLSCSKSGKITNQDSVIFTIKSSRPRVRLPTVCGAGTGPRERCGPWACLWTQETPTSPSSTVLVVLR